MREATIAARSPDVAFVTSLFEGFVDDAVTSVGSYSEAVPTAVVLYDLIPLLRPDEYLRSDVARRWYEGKIASLRKADVLLSISRHTRDEAISALQLPTERVVEIGAGLDPSFEPRSVTLEARAELFERYRIRRPFVMYTGGVDARKNLERLIEAFASLAPELRAQYQLAIVGQAAELDVARLGVLARRAGLADDSVVFTGYAADKDLVALYGCCSLFTFPSLHEGFGLPALEAMACGAPTIASDASSIPEVIGLKDALFDPKQAESIAAKLTRGLTDSDFRRALVESGLERAKQFTWEAAGSKALAVLHELANASPPRPRPPASDVLSGMRTALQRSSEFRGLSKQEQVAISHACAQSISVDTLPRFLVDVTTISEQDSQTGIQRCVRAFALEFLRRSPHGYKVEFVRLDLSAGTYLCATAFLARLEGASSTSGADEPIEVWPGDVFLGIDLVADRLPAMEAWFTAQRNRGLAVYFVVYDLLPVQLPHHFLGAMPSVFERWLYCVGSVADGLFCISKTVQEDLIAWLAQETPWRDRPLRIGSFPLGADFEATAATRGLPPVYPAVMAAFRDRPMFLMVGTVEPRKGHVQVLEAFDGLWAGGLDIGLVIVGKPGWLMEGFIRDVDVHAEAGRRLFWVRQGSDEFIDQAYRSSAALIAASFGEGFGLPLIEAARHGLSIIARDIAVFREVAGDGALYFPDGDASAIGHAVERWLALRQENAAPLSNSIEWVTWAESADRLAALASGSATTVEWLPDVRLRPGTRLRFDSHRLEWTGWSTPEATHRWSSGTFAALGFSLKPDCDWAGHLLLDFHTFGPQRICLQLNGKKLGEWTKETSRERWHLRLPLESLHFTAGERLEFLLPDARIPGAHDQRSLAIALRSLEFQ